eukprot:13400648-Ditylum_brightwellii.AAC.1
MSEVSIGVSTEASERDAIEHDEATAGDRASTEASSADTPSTPTQSSALSQLLSPIAEEDEEEQQSTTLAIEEAKDINECGGYQTFTKTRSERVVRPIQQFNMATMALTKAKFGYQANLEEMAMLEFADEDYKLDFEVGAVGAGIGGGSNNTRELKAMKYNEAMATGKEVWTTEIEEELKRM